MHFLRSLTAETVSEAFKKRVYPVETKGLNQGEELRHSVGQTGEEQEVSFFP